MNELVKRVAYLKGLAEGFQLDKNSNESKLLLEIIDTLEAFSVALQSLQESHEELSDFVEDVDDSVTTMERLLFEEEEEAMQLEDMQDAEDEEDDGLIEYDCPHCETTLFFDEDTFSMEEEHTCPNCGKPIFSEDEDGEDDD